MRRVELSRFPAAHNIKSKPIGSTVACLEVTIEACLTPPRASQIFGLILNVESSGSRGLQPVGHFENSQFTIHVRDAPGEAAFPGPKCRAKANPHAEQDERSSTNGFPGAKGIVLVISALNAGTDAGLRSAD
jgi:hypothetical protein